LKTLEVRLPGKEYMIEIGSDTLSQVGRTVRFAARGNKAAIITDRSVDALYGDRVRQSLKDEGFDLFTVAVEPGEGSKSMEVYSEVCERLLEGGLTRKDIVVALGGGVVGDLAGFVAATVLRGVDFVQIPTTLLSQVDSSVGGKVAVNLKAGKNLAGAFHQPKAVVIDTNCLNTLPDRVFSDGMAEVIKYGAIEDADLFRRLSSLGGRSGIMSEIEDVIYTCVDIKRRIVEADEKDEGGRMVLNFGHTLGHAYEKSGGYSRYTHGEAVAAGMVKIAEIGEETGITEKGCSDKLRSLIRMYGLPESIEIGLDEYAQAVGVDKKAEGSMINLIFIEDIGKAVIRKMDTASLMELLGRVEG